MSRTLNNLNARKVEALLKHGDSPTKHGWYSDGGGLYLKIDKQRERKDGEGFSQAKRWVLVFFEGGKRREMGLGGAAEISLADARKERDKARTAIKDGRDPIAARQANAVAADPARDTPTFREFAETYIAAHKSGWRNEKHVWQWKNTLIEKAAGLGSIPVDKITTDDVLAVLRPLWSEIPETAQRLRQRIEKVLDAAAAAGHRDRDQKNPAEWRGHLEHFLPKRLKKSLRPHYAAVPWREMPDFWRKLATRRPSSSVSALRFTILGANRSGEVRLAKRKEFDLKARRWTIPAERMKMSIEHWVPLTPPMLAILKQMKIESLGPEDYVFPGANAREPLSDMAMLMLMRDELARTESVHGFRSAFRDWAGEATEYPRDLAEMALAHAVGDEVERAYRRERAFEKRRPMMEDWSDYLSGEKKRLEEPANLDLGAVIAALSEGRPLPAEQARALVAMLQANSTVG